MTSQHNHNAKLNPKRIEQIMKEPAVRRNVAAACHLWFFVLYFWKRMTSPMAPFHKEIFKLTEDEKIKNVVIEAFRGSSKTTIVCTSYAIWSILGCQQRKFVLILGQTQSQARQYLANIKTELENNEVLKADMGPFDEPDDDWRSDSIVIPKFGARITVASIEKSIRGLNHAGHRPDLIICDDLENLDSVKTIENRDKVFNWLTGDVIPMGSKRTRLVVIGTRLHEDSILMRLKKAMAEGKMDGMARSYPLLDEKNKIAWPGMYPTMADIETLKRSVPSAIAWEREYMLRIIAPEDQVIRTEWIHYYDHLPDDGISSDFRFAATGVDLAISEKESADYTAMVSAKVFGRGSNLRIHILPNPVNERMNFPKTVARAMSISRAIGDGVYTRLYIENTAYQQSLVDELKKENVPAEEFKTQGQDKRMRLTLTTNLLQSEKILFPRHGADHLVQQLTGFGKERHDDLADAFSILILKVMSAGTQEFFPEWDKAKHVVKRMDIPDSWRRYRSISFGLNGYVSCHWIAVDFKGVAWIYNEYYATGKDHAAHAKAIAKQSETAEGVQEKYFVTILDNSAFERQGVGETAYEIYSRAGIEGVRSGKDPEMKWNSIRHYLASDKNGEPKLKVFDDNRHIIKAIPTLAPDPTNRKDVEKTSDTAAIDDTGYLLQVLRDEGSRPPENLIQRRMRMMGFNSMSNINPNDL